MLFLLYAIHSMIGFLCHFILDDDTTLYLNWNPVSNEHELVKLLQDYNSSPISIYASSADYLICQVQF